MNNYLDLNLIPTQYNKKGICTYGEVEYELEGFTKEYENGYTNFLFTEQTVLNDFIPFRYLDGFSPNLNKHLHLGHFSNLVIAKTFQKLGIAHETIAIYGDALEGNDYKNKHYMNFDYDIHIEYFASTISYYSNTHKLKKGDGDYENTMIINFDGNKYVMIKSDKKTTYLYQDLALIETLNAKTLYLTGEEQKHHFEILRKYSDNVNHLPLGLVTINGEKMSSRVGNVFYMSDVIEMFRALLNVYDLKLVYNCFAGYILNTNPSKSKTINTELLTNLKSNYGLYISYTTARLYNMTTKLNDELLVTLSTRFIYLKSKHLLNPSLLFKWLISLCEQVNSNYKTLNSKDGFNFYSQLYSDILFCINKLGLYVIEKV